jgi:hypothetical protein
VTPERALEIIDACGADSRRWPAEEREALTLLAIADPVVAAALAEARDFDSLLKGWATDVAPAAPLDAATLIPAPAVRSASSQRQRWWIGSAAAGAAIGLLFLPNLQAQSPSEPPSQIAATMTQNVSPVPSATGESDVLAEAEVFATVFTPTADEDQLI